MRLCLVCSSGGHLLELHSLREFWSRHERFWVTFPTEDSRYFLRDERVFWAHHPTNRNLPNLFRNFLLARRLLREQRPDVVISTGAGVAVPFIYVAAAMGTRTVYVESLTRINGLSLSGRLVYPVVGTLLVQWPQLAKRCRKARYQGQVL